MNVDKFRPRIQTEDSLRSITMKSETLFKQIHAKPQKTLKIMLTQPKETFSFKPSMLIERS